MKTRYLTFFLFAFLVLATKSLAQNIFDVYHPPYVRLPSSKLDKPSNNTQIDSIIIYIAPPFILKESVYVQDTVDMLELCQTTAAAWNKILASEKIPLYLKIAKLPENSPASEVVFGNGSQLHLIGMTNHDEYLPIGVSLYGGCKTMKYDSTIIGNQKFFRSKNTHIGLNFDLYKTGFLLARSKADYFFNRPYARHQIYITLCHEIGHFLGISHGVPPESIMQAGPKKQNQTFLHNYAGTGDIPLQSIENKILRSIYAQFFISDRHKNDTCIPWSNLPTTQDTLEVQR